MEAKEMRKFDRGEREEAFMTDNADDFPKDSPGDKVIKLMRDDIALVRQYAAGQAGGTDERAQHVDEKDDLMDELMNTMRLLDYAADAQADEFPGIENLYGLPRNRSEQSILAAARAQYDASAQHEAGMIEYDLPQTFRADMLDLINRINQANQSADIAGEHGTGSTGGLKAAISRLNKNSKKLDRISRIKYRNDPEKLAAWIRASHLERDPQPARKTDAPPTP